MSTLTATVMLRKTEKQNREILFDFRGVFPDIDNDQVGKVSLIQGQSKTIAASKVLCAYFPKPTIIQLTIDSVDIETTVDGTLLLPFACEMQVAYTNPTTTDPLVFHYVVA
jgi:hypothetical protein